MVVVESFSFWFQSKQYSHFEEFESDVLLLITNAHTFNEPRSQISKV